MIEWSRSKQWLVCGTVILASVEAGSAGILSLQILNSTPTTDGEAERLAELRANCSLHREQEEVEGAFSAADVSVSLVAIFYLFLLLAEVCEGYLVPSIKTVCYKVGVSGEVGGALVLAAAVSSPDLFISLAATFLTEGDAGLGTVFGCGIVNLFIVPPACIFFSDVKRIGLDWWSVSRDVSVNGVSLLVLAFTLRDNLVFWYEALLLVLIYLTYIILLSNDSAIRETVELVWRKLTGVSDSEAWPILRKTGSFFKEEELKIEDIEEEGLGLSGRLWRLVRLPVDVLLRVSVPDPKKGRFLLLTVFCSLAWIGAASYLSAWIITLLGVLLGIPDSLMGLTLIAAGMSVPGVLSSVIVAKQGEGGMAVANALGSNIFDVLAVLGVPWLVKTALVSQRPLEVGSTGLPLSSLLLLVTLSLLYLSLLVSRFAITVQVSVLCLVMYVVFLVLASLLEMNVIFIGNPVPCQL